MTIPEIRKYLKEQGSVERAEKMKTIVPGATTIYGVKMPVLNELAKMIKDGGFDLVENLWKAGAYEEKMLAAKLLRLIARQDPEKAIALVKNYAEGIDNWAICDTLGMQSLKSINKKFAKEVFGLAHELSVAEDFWKRRLSLVLVEDFAKQKAFHPAINKLIDKQRGDKTYYIKKAVVWLDASVKKHT